MPVIGMPSGRTWGTPRVRPSSPYTSAEERTSGQAVARDAEQRADRRSTGAARRGRSSSVREALLDVGGVRRTGGEARNEVAVHRAEAGLPALGLLARAVDVIEEPGELGAGEIGVEHQAGALADQRLRAGPRRLEARRTCVGRAAVLPDDGVVQRLAACGDPRAAVVSRCWLVMPMAATSRPSIRAASMACPSAVTTDDQMASGSCSTQPGSG